MIATPRQLARPRWSADLIVVGCPDAAFESAWRHLPGNGLWLRAPGAAPRLGDHSFAEAARFALAGGGVIDVVVCGHSGCSHYAGDGPARRAVVGQLAALREHPVVGPAVDDGQARLHGMFHDADGFWAYDDVAGLFLPADTL